MATSTETAQAAPVAQEKTSAAKAPSTKEQRERIEALYESRQVPEEKKRAPENFTKLGAARWINLLESYPLKEEADPAEIKAQAAKDAELARTRTTRGRKSVSTRRVPPQEPDYSKMPARSRPAAKRAYAKALADWKAAEKKAAEAKIDSKTNVIGSKVTGRKRASRSQPKAEENGFDWKAADLPGRIVELKSTGLTIKQVSEKLGFPADAGERIWHRVSLIYRAEADRQSIARPGRRPAKK